MVVDADPAMADHWLPGMSGVELLAAVHVLRDVLHRNGLPVGFSPAWHLVADPQQSTAVPRPP